MIGFYEEDNIIMPTYIIYITYIYIYEYIYIHVDIYIHKYVCIIYDLSGIESIMKFQKYEAAGVVFVAVKRGVGT